MQPPKSQTTPRLDHLDGLRTVAILWVALYHYAYFWAPAGKGTNLLPYGDALAQVIFADVGYLGVYLFFIVSGFVIAMSLTRSASLGRFTVNRAIRLWPTLIICGTITFIATSLFGPEDLRRGPLEYLISLTFVPPPHVGKAIGVADMEWLDGAYWSLWTEVRFYITAALLYFAMKSRFLLSWTVFAAACCAVHVGALINGGALDAVSRLIYAEHQPFFTAGIALASMRFSQNRWAKWLLTAAIAQAFAYPALANGGLSDHEAAGLIVVFVLAIPVMLSRESVPILSSRLFATLGVASYAYYLLHQNTGLALLNIPDGLTPLAAIGTMLGIQLGIMLFSVALTKWIEVPLRRALRQRFTPRPVVAMPTP